MGRVNSEDAFVKLTGFKLLTEHEAGGGYENRAFSHDQDAVTGGSGSSAVKLRQDADDPGNYEQFQLSWRGLSFQVSQSGLERAASKLKEVVGNRISDGKGHNVGNKAGTRYVFNDLNGYIRSGEITAILGPSGAGKTSLLKAICGLETSNFRGSIQLAGGRHKQRMQVSIIPQRDFLDENLTVRESLSYSSRILNVDKRFDHGANIDRVVKVLNLMSCLDTICKNLSGGEYKRISIAQELLRQPDVLVLDEPTSGLDSLNCKKLISTLRDLIESSLQGSIAPIAIVMTIHQPDIEIYSMFDHVYCLAPGGRVIFDGHPSTTLDVLRTRGGVELGDEQVSLINPANLLIEIASQVYDDETIDRLAAHHREQSRKYWKSVEAPRSAGDIRDDPNGMTAAQKHNQLFRDKRLNAKSHRNRGLFLYHTWLITKRTFLGTVRDPTLTLSSLAVYFTIPFVMWAVFGPNEDQTGSCPRLVRNISVFAMVDGTAHIRMRERVQDLATAYENLTMFFITTYTFVICCAVVSAMTFPLSMHILLKEVRNGWYGMSSFVWAKTLANFPAEIIFPSVSLVMVYYMLAMPSSYMHWRMIALAFVVALLVMLASTQGLVFGALLMDYTEAAAFFAAMVGISGSVISGLTARINQMPAALQLMSWFNPLRYCAEMIAIIRFGYGICECDPETEEYIKNNKPKITDLPDGMGAAVRLFLNTQRDSAGDSESDAIETTTSTMATAIASNFRPIPGIEYGFGPNATREEIVRELINSGQMHFMDEFAKLFAKAFSYGLDINTCKEARAYNVQATGMLEEEWLPWLFAMLVGLLVLWKIGLYILVRFKIQSRL